MALPGEKTKLATRRVIRTPSGQARTVFVDMNTGEVVTNLTDYSVVEQGEFMGTRVTPSSSNEKENKETGFLSEEMLHILLGEDEWLKRNGRSDNTGFSGAKVERTPENNFGWIDKPKIMSWLSKIPGFAGAAAKAINLGINTNNLAAESAAKEYYGIEDEQSTGENLKEAIKGPDGEIGNVKGTNVDLDGKSDDGRPAFTPAEISNQEKAGFTAVTPASSALDEGRKSPTGVATAESSAGKKVGPGGFANLAGGVEVENVSFSMGNRSGKPNDDISAGIGAAVHHVLGPGYSVVVTSGKGLTKKESLGKKKPSGRHTKGKGADFAIFDPSGRQLNVYDDKEAMVAVAQMLAASGFTGIGIGPGYMGGAHIHADKAFPGRPQAWGRGESITGMPADIKAAVYAGWGATIDAKGNPKFGTIEKTVPASYNGGKAAMGTPEAAPGVRGGTPVAENVAFKADQETVGAKVTQAALSQPKGNQPAPPTAPQTFKTENLPEDVAKMALAIAGELGPQTIQGLLSGDPAQVASARAEIAGIAGTMVNRANSSRYSSSPNPMQGVLNPDNFHPFKAENMAQTQDNYSRAGELVRAAVEDFLSGKLPSPAPDATHYRSEDFAAPSWERYAIGQPTPIGKHVFSQIAIPGTNTPEYSRAGFSAAEPPATQVASVATENTITDVSPQQGGFTNPSVQTNTPAEIGSRISTPVATPSNSKMSPISTAPTPSYSQAQVQAASKRAEQEFSRSPAPTQSQPTVPGFTGPVNVDVVEVPDDYFDNMPSYQELADKAAAARADAMNQQAEIGHSRNLAPGNTIAGMAVESKEAFAAPQDPGLFGNAPGGGYGQQSLAGIQSISEFGENFGGSLDPGGIDAAEDSFYGADAGSLSGSASGFGTGLGAVGKSGTYGLDTGSNVGVSLGDSGHSQNRSENAGKGSSIGGAGFGGLPADTRSSAYTGARGDTASKSSATASRESFSAATSAASKSNNANNANKSSGSRESISGNAQMSAMGISNSESEGANKVLCGYFYKKGRIPKKIYMADLRYSKDYMDEYTKQGYLIWAKPLVAFLEKKNSKTLDNIIFPLTKGWVYEMAYRVGAYPKRSLWGRLVTGVGEFVCNKIGKLL